MKTKNLKSVLMLTAVLATAAVFSACKNNGNEPATIDLPAQFANVEIADTGGSQTIQFSATADWTVTVKDETRGTEWLTVTPTSGKAGSNISLTLIVQPNTIDVERTATVTITAGNAKQSFTVTQTTNVPIVDAVVINGVKWATRNVDAFGTFAPSPESLGMYYQWNRPTAWAAIGDVTGWNNSDPTGTTWEAANDPCPNGWRVPTKGELDGLLGVATHTWATQNGINGMLFGSGNNTIFLPAAGYLTSVGIGYNEGTHRFVGTDGFYWGCTGDSSGYYDYSSAYCLTFGNGQYYTYSYSTVYGFPVRCVAK